MTDYLITNDPFDLGGQLDTTSGKFDPDFADHSIRLTDNVLHGVKLPETDSIWISFDCWFPSGGSGEDGYFWRVFSQDNVVMLRFNISNDDIYFISVQGAGDESFSISIPRDQVFRIDILIETNLDANPNNHRETLYVNGSITAQSQLNGGGGGAPSRFEFGGNDFLAPDEYWVSNVRITDENPVGTKFKVLGPTGAGNYSDFVGGHVELGDFLATTVAYAEADGDRVSATLTPGSQPPGTLTKTMVSSTTRSTGPGADPSQIGVFVRIGTTDYDGALVQPGASIVPIVEEYTVNPDTGLPWEWSDFTGLEIGLRAAT